MTITAATTLTATYVIVPQYTLNILSANGGTTVPAAGSYAYDEGSIVTVSQTANTDWNFAYWLLDGVQKTGATIQVTMSANHTLQPVFTRKTVTLTIAAGTGGTVNPSGAQTLEIGVTYTITAVPDTVTYPNYYFDHWTLGGTNYGSQNPLQLRITSDMAGKTLQAFFTQKPYDTITLTVAKVGTGTVNPYGTVTLNIDPVNPSSFTATDVTGSGWTFDHWEFSWDASQKPTTRQISVYITAALQGTTITAVFRQIMYSVTINSTPISGVTITLTEMN